MREKTTSTAVVVGALGRVTFHEIVRDKVLYNIVLCGLLLLGAGFLASRLTFRPSRVIIDFGLSAMNFSGTVIAVFVGATSLSREFERRTALVALSRPITRLQFVLGKFVGVAGVLVVNWILLSGCFLGVLLLSDGRASPTLGVALLLSMVQSLLMAAIAMAFASSSTVSLSVIFCAGIYLVGTNISAMRLVAQKATSPVMLYLLRWAATFLPNLEHFNLGTKATYGLPVAAQFVGAGLAYAAVLISLSLLAAGILIRSRES